MSLKGCKSQWLEHKNQILKAKKVIISRSANDQSSH
jgi:hypothetical protein